VLVRRAEWIIIFCFYYCHCTNRALFGLSTYTDLAWLTLTP